MTWILLTALLLVLAAGSQARSAVPPIAMPSDATAENVEITPCRGGEKGYPLTLPIRNRRTGVTKDMLVLFSQPIAEAEYIDCFYALTTDDGLQHAVHIH
jgi:hypothetical protein